MGLFPHPENLPRPRLPVDDKTVHKLHFLLPLSVFSADKSFRMSSVWAHVQFNPTRLFSGLFFGWKLFELTTQAELLFFLSPAARAEVKNYSTQNSWPVNTVPGKDFHQCALA